MGAGRCMYVETANFYFENSIRCKFLYRKFPIDWAPCKTVIEIYWCECEMAKSCSGHNATGFGRKCVVLCSMCLNQMLSQIGSGRLQCDCMMCSGCELGESEIHTCSNRATHIE